MLQINISTQPIRLAYDIQNAQLSLKSNPAKVQIKTMPPELEIRQPRGELTIDQTPCRYSIGLKNIADFARDNAKLARRIALEAIARIAEEGDRLARIQSKSNALAEIAAESTRSKAPDLTWAHIDLPNIHYQAKPVQFHFTAGKINFTPYSGTVQGDYRPGRVNIRVIQYPRVEISTVDVKA